MALERAEQIERIEVEFTARELRLIDLAAHERGLTRTEYIADVVNQDALEQFDDPQTIHVDDETFVWLNELAENPAPNPKLRALMEWQAPWSSGQETTNDSNKRMYYCLGQSVDPRR